MEIPAANYNSGTTDN